MQWHSIFIFLLQVGMIRKCFKKSSSTLPDYFNFWWPFSVIAFNNGESFFLNPPKPPQMTPQLSPDPILSLYKSSLLFCIEFFFKLINYANVISNCWSETLELWLPAFILISLIFAPVFFHLAPFADEPSVNLLAPQVPLITHNPLLVCSMGFSCCTLLPLPLPLSPLLSPFHPFPLTSPVAFFSSLYFSFLCLLELYFSNLSVP